MLRDDAIWSDGSTVKAEDVIATFDAFRKKALNKNIATLLADVNVSSAGTGEILITSKTKNPLMVNLLSYPILRSDITDQILNGRIKKETYVTSGPFMYDDSVDDTEYGFHRITLVKNPQYTAGEVWLDKLNFKIFPDVPSMERAIDTLSVIIPPLNQTVRVDQRFKAVNYNTYEFFGIFLQTDRLDKNIRNILHNAIGRAFVDNFPSDITHTPMNTIFLT